MKQKGLLLALLAVVLVVSLSLYGKKDAPPAPDPTISATTADADDTASSGDNSSTIDKLSAQTPDTTKEVLTITNEMLAECYETGWELAQSGRGNLSDKEWLKRESYDLRLYGIDPDSGEAMDVCGYSTTISWALIELGKTVSNSDELNLPDDGLEKFAEWRKEFTGATGNSGGTNSSNNSNSGSGNQGTTNPGGSNGSSGNSSSNSGSNSSGSSGSGGDPEPWYPEGHDDIPLNVRTPDDIDDSKIGTSNPGEDGYGYGFAP